MKDEFTREWRNDLRKDRQERHRKWKKNNTAFLHKMVGGRFKIVNNGEAILFREEGFPKIDFYPSTGRWRIAEPGEKAFSGGAQKFVDWYLKQKEK